VKLSISWLILALGCLLGLAACVVLGLDVVSLSVGAFGHALLGLTFLTGSLVALHRRRLAGLIFLTVMPVGAFCLAYPGSGFLVSRERLVGCSVPFLLPGLFWLRTGMLGWPALVQARGWSLTKRASTVAAACVGILCLDVVLTVLFAGLNSSLFNADCAGSPPVLHQEVPTQAVFTAKVVFAARSIDAQRNSGGGVRSPDGGRQLGDWAIGIVQERFWGMPRWTRLVLLTNYVYWQGETYFVDGRRVGGLLTRFLPIVEGGIGCSRTKPIEHAIVDVRLLRRPPPPGATRLVGYVRGPEVFTAALVRPTRPASIAGATIEVTGPAGTRSITTDGAGVYELDGLAPGDYTLHLATPDTQTVGSFADDGSPARIRLDYGGVVETNFEVLWNGRIEGKVTDDSGTPARAWVLLLSADGRQLPGYTHFYEKTATDGSYRFHRIPQGRYLVVVNPSGPHDQWPHDIRYYPGGVRKENAQVLELANGQRLGGVDFRIPGR
jgi:hypothetical protein